jgi:hypothetical protein
MKNVGAGMKKIADNVTDSWLCVDCGVDTTPGIPNGATIRAQVTLTGGSNPVLAADGELYHVHDKVWAKAGMEPWGGCLRVGCLERRLGRKLKPEDFPRRHAFNRPDLPRSERLEDRTQTTC